MPRVSDAGFGLESWIAQHLDGFASDSEPRSRPETEMRFPAESETFKCTLKQNRSVAGIVGAFSGVSAIRPPIAANTVIQSPWSLRLRCWWMEFSLSTMLSILRVRRVQTAFRPRSWKGDLFFIAQAASECSCVANILVRSLTNAVPDELLWNRKRCVQLTRTRRRDTCAVPPGLSHSLAPAMTGEASLYRVRATADKAGPTWKG